MSAGSSAPRNKPATVLFASLIGTTIEFFDFYIYATAAVLVFPKLFFPAGDAAAATLQSLATFAIAFATIATAAPLLLARGRFGQGLGLGGEWGGAVLLATENAPPGKRAWYGMFPQLGAPLGFFLSGSIFLLLSETMSDAAFFAWGWRIPFLASALLVAVGLYVRLKITETPDFQAVLERNERVRLPVVEVLTKHMRPLVLGTFGALSTFVIFYLMTVFALSWGTTALGYSRQQFLMLQLFAIVFFGLTIPLAAVLADRHGRRAAMVAVSAAIALFGLVLGPMFGSGSLLMVTLFMVLGQCLIGMTYGPLGTLLSELFPPEVRYTGASLTFNLAGILGASLAPYIATWLATHHGLAWVGWYLSAAAVVSLVALLMTGERRQPAVAPAR
jgi:MFS family permease